MLNEYTMEVTQDGKRELLKTFSNTVEGAIDNMVKIDNVNYLHNISETNTGDTWELEEDLTDLRNLRKRLPSNIEMLFEVRRD